MGEHVGSVLVVESSEAKEPHLPLGALRTFGLSVYVANSSLGATMMIRQYEPIVIFLAAQLNEGPSGERVQAVIKDMAGEYNPSLIALDPEIIPTWADWRLDRRQPNLEAKLYGLMKSVLMARGFRQVLVVQDPRAAEKIAERVFAPAGCVRIGTYHTAGLALEGAWRHQPPIIVLDKLLGAGSTGAEFLRDLAGLEGYHPLVIGLSKSLAKLGAGLTVERGTDFETELRSTLREAQSWLGRKAPNANA